MHATLQSDHIKLFHDLFQKILEEYDGFFFIPLASRLINDESTRCKKLVAVAIKSLLAKVFFEKNGDMTMRAYLYS